VSIHLTLQLVIEVSVPALKMSSNVYVSQVYPFPPVSTIFRLDVGIVLFFRCDFFFFLYFIATYNLG
jgi:hypothetical protein